jgi:hypothetical protein
MLTLCTSSRAPLSSDDARPNASDTAFLGGIDTNSFANTIARSSIDRSEPRRRHKIASGRASSTFWAELRLSHEHQPSIPTETTRLL